MSVEKKANNYIASIKKWFKNHNIYSKKFYKKNKAKKRWLAIFLSSFVSAFLTVAIVVSAVALPVLNKITRDPNTSINVEVPDSAKDVYEGKDIVNIMLYGIDSRDMQEMSRSDSILLVTVDRKHKKVKMTSIARDTRVDILGYGKDKLNHAFIYGWQKEGNIAGGAKLSLQTINNTFNLNVTDYVTANFWALATIIDYIGGVDIDVDAKERYDINKNYTSYIRKMGIDCEDIPTTGMQHLTGGQAVAYCRVRHVGGDVMRGQRQREVLMAMYDVVKGLPLTKQMKVVELILSECSTSLTNTELISLGTWALKNINTLQFETLGIPTEDIEQGGYINGVWYFTYDVDLAAKKIENFILENDEQETTEVTEN